MAVDQFRFAGSIEYASPLWRADRIPKQCGDLRDRGVVDQREKYKERKKRKKKGKRQKEKGNKGKEKKGKTGRSVKIEPREHLNDRAP